MQNLGKSYTGYVRMKERVNAFQISEQVISEKVFNTYLDVDHLSFSFRQ